MLTLASSILFGITFCVLAAMVVPLWCMGWIRSQRLPAPPRWPGISLIKPMAGLDDELQENLRSHLAIDYPGPWEILLGVRSEQDAAYPLARAFAEASAGRARVVLQQGEPGYNPKVNQLITLTREARYEVISLTDSNVRVAPGFLREAASALALPGVGLATNLIAGVGERRLGAVLDNMMLTIHVAPLTAAASVLVGMNDFTGKALAIRRDVLEHAGGWRSLRKILAEDQVLGRALLRLGLRVAFCPTPIQNVQVSQPLGSFYRRQTRWLIIRYRNIFPAVLLEPITLSTLTGLLGALFSPDERLAWILFLVAGGMEFAIIQACAIVLRGRGFKPLHLMLEPLRELLFLAAWVAAAAKRKVDWRGNEFMILEGTRLAPRAVVQRANRIRRRHKLPPYR